MSDRKVYVAARVVTCDSARATTGNALGAIENAAVVVENGVIADIVDRKAAGTNAIDFGSRTITPGLVDAHTHAAWSGSRHDEYAMKMAGADYRDIAKAGGGIVASHRAIVACDEPDLVDEIAARLKRMASLGVTTCEVKSGYGLERDQELKQLCALSHLANRPDLPQIVPTLLALHALPKSATDRSAYVAGAADLVDTVASEKLARFVDAYVDANAFSADEARIVGERAKKAKLGVRLHVGQFADVGGAELAAELGARSADHLENVSDAALARMAEAGVAAGLLPIACLTLNQAKPRVDAMRKHGIQLVVASDANPGTAPSESLPLAMALAVRLYGLTPEEAILGATANAARSLDVDAGVMRIGAPADLVVWDLPHERAIVQPWGVSKAALVVRGGMPIFKANS